MSTLTLSAFDTLRYVKELRAADVPEKQAEAQAEALRRALADQAAMQAEHVSRAVTELDTKAERAVLHLQSEMANKGDVALVRKDMEALENRLILKLSAVMVALIGFAGAVLAVVNKLA